MRSSTTGSAAYDGRAYISSRSAARRFFGHAIGLGICCRLGVWPRRSNMEGGAVRRWVLEDTDYVYPRTTNKILEAFLKSKGVAPEDIRINYTPFGHSDWRTRGCRDQELCCGRQKGCGRQKDSSDLDDQRRHQCAVL